MKSQAYLEQINSWSENQKMEISQKKTKAMIVNFSKKYQFTTRLNIKKLNVEIVKQMKILGNIINDDLSWGDNCTFLIKKVNQRMELLRRAQSFGATNDEMVHLWVVYCRNILEQSCAIWHSSITEENSDDLERTQKAFTKLTLQNKYKDYDTALLKLNLTKLSERRQMLMMRFCENGIKTKTLVDLFPENEKTHKMETRAMERFKVTHAGKERLKRSSVINMQNALNQKRN